MRHYTKADARARVGDRVMIDGFEIDGDGTMPRTEHDLIGKTGIVEYIDDMGSIHGTWWRNLASSSRQVPCHQRGIT